MRPDPRVVGVLLLWACLLAGTQATTVCSAWGDPHYTTFDGVVHHFQGSCNYTFAKDCGNTNSSDFHVITRNVQTLSNPAVSAVREVYVEALGFVVGILPGMFVTVGGVPYSLPFYLADGQIIVGRLPAAVLVELRPFRVLVLFDGSHEIKVFVSSHYIGRMCGLCGNNNGDQSDDFMLPGGVIVDINDMNINIFGNSWYIDVDNTTCPNPPDQLCEDDVRAAAEEACWLLKNVTGPFAVCHDTVDPEIYFQTCAFDMCALELSTTAFCQNLEAYADECRDAGVEPFAWRTEDRCPVNCPEGSRYSICASYCPATCPNPNAPKNCTHSCVEGCECDAGFLLSGPECVPEERCGCITDYGRYFMLGERWSDDGGYGCLCEEGNVITCDSVTAIIPVNPNCNEAEGYKWVLRAGVWGCYCVEYQCSVTTVCYAWGDPHYHLFDGGEHHFQGPCRYTLAKDYGTSCDFIVEAQNQPITSAPHLSFVSDVYVEAYGLTVGIHQGKKVTVDGELHSPPFSKAVNKILVYMGGLYVHVWLVNYGVFVTYDGFTHVQVAVPNDYRGSMCGLCGNFNGNPLDDFMTPDGTIVSDVNIFGNSWLTDNETCPDDPPPTQPPDCSDDLRADAEMACGVLTDDNGPFAVCHSEQDPQRFFSTCVFDICGLGGDTRGLCQNLEAYVEACVKAGVDRISWRTPERCPFNCPENSNFSSCASSCPATCLNPTPPENCDRGCAEGCECDDGFFLSGQTCVLEEQCGCTDDEGRYFVLGERWGGDGETCVCEAGNSITCEACSEDDGHELVLVDGVYECLCVEDRCNECISDPCQNGATCNDRVNGYTCTCAPGYEGVHCETDINECVVGTDDCDRDATCTNTLGSFTCSCNRGYLGDGRRCVEINECSSDPCENGATCNDGINGYTCTCAPGYEGDRCGTDTDECDSNPCQNGATCNDGVNGYNCTCVDGYEGGHCETDTDECDSNPCQNGATCNDRVNGYNCTCAPGYEGDDCETEVDECMSYPCENGATCDDEVNDYTCTCAGGYEGDDCETEIDECMSYPCENGGTCNDEVNGYTCTCAPGYEGDHCETELDVCDSHSCQNGATCNDEVNGYTCTCAPGYEGDHCETEINECSSDPCQNGATCNDEVNGYTCTCAPGYEGDHCETEIAQGCSSDPCQNGATCNDGVNGYTCTCAPGYEGDHCETDINECATVNCEGNRECVNTPGSYECLCKNDRREFRDRCLQPLDYNIVTRLLEYQVYQDLLDNDPQRFAKLVRAIRREVTRLYKAGMLTVQQFLNTDILEFVP